jgi:hypothetical protein
METPSEGKTVLLTIEASIIPIEELQERLDNILYGLEQWRNSTMITKARQSEEDKKIGRVLIPCLEREKDIRAELIIIAKNAANIRSYLGTKTVKTIQQDKGCTLQTPPVSLKVTLETVLHRIRDIQSDIETVDTELAASSSDPKKSLHEPAVATAMCEAVSDIYTALVQSHLELSSKLATLNSAASRIITGDMLGLLDQADCVKEAVPEKTDLTGCTRTIIGLQCSLEIVQFSARHLVRTLLAVPIQTDPGIWTQIDLGRELTVVERRNPALALEGKDCTIHGQSLRCPHRQDSFAPDACLEAVLANGTLGTLTRYCQFESVQETEPLIHQTIEGTLVSQRLSSNLVVQLGDQVISNDPALIIHRRELLVHTSGNTRKIKGLDVEKEEIRTLRTRDEEDLKELNAPVNEWEEWLNRHIPKSLHQLIYGLLATFGTCLLTGSTICLCKCCGCCEFAGAITEIRVMKRKAEDVQVQSNMPNKHQEEIAMLQQFKENIARQKAENSRKKKGKKTSVHFHESEERDSE